MLKIGDRVKVHSHEWVIPYTNRGASKIQFYPPLGYIGIIKNISYGGVELNNWYIGVLDFNVVSDINLYHRSFLKIL
jgi:hypothetical protein